jgi:hypothetical protein
MPKMMANPASAWIAPSYTARAFGTHFPEVLATLERLATSLPPEELNRVGFRRYERFRPSVLDGGQGWGANTGNCESSGSSAHRCCDRRRPLPNILSVPGRRRGVALVEIQIDPVTHLTRLLPVAHPPPVFTKAEHDEAAAALSALRRQFSLYHLRSNACAGACDPASVPIASAEATGLAACRT